MSANNIQKKTKSCKPMPENKLRALIELCGVPTSRTNDREVFNYIVSTLNRMGVKYSLDGSGNIIARNGSYKNFPCFCSHIDTVHNYPNNLQILSYEHKGHVILKASDNGKEYGIGGDDKCGIFTCLHLLTTLENCMCVFFTGEESGCIGSSEIDLKIFNGARFVCSVDRWGNSDFICKYMGEKTISDNLTIAAKGILNAHGYKDNSGLITDCFTLYDRGVNVSCFNISCGYYMHHSNKEIIDTNELFDCMNVCVELAVSCTDVYTHKRQYSVYNQYGNFGKYSKYSFGGHLDREIYDNSPVNYSDVGEIIAGALNDLWYQKQDLFYESVISEVCSYIAELYPSQLVTRSDIENFRDC
jgi:tripeptide aminopeptidase